MVDGGGSWWVVVDGGGWWWVVAQFILTPIIRETESFEIIKSKENVSLRRLG